MMFAGFNVTYYTQEGCGLRVCGLIELSSMSSGQFMGTPEQYEAKLDEIGAKFHYNSPKGEGNFLFSLSSSQIQSYGDVGFIGWLVHHPNTKIIHYYKNNAHGPSVVFIFIHHRWPDQVSRKMVNNSAKILAQLQYSHDGHSMKKEVSCS